MEQEILNLQKKLDEQAMKIDAVYKSVEKIRKYMLITAWVTILVIVLPLIGLAFAIPAFLNNYVGTLNRLGI
ncbi:MAG: hypothetical protein Q8O46_05480 [bacterium]|nr:hypothetical protein [bacterium]